MIKINNSYFKEAFKGHNVPKKIRKTSENICKRFNIRGICDPMYISNVIAKESGSGDGLSNFTSDNIKNIKIIVDRLRFAYSSNIKKTEIKELQKLLSN